jgi:hypothetical protein
MASCEFEEDIHERAIRTTIVANKDEWVRNFESLTRPEQAAVKKFFRQFGGTPENIAFAFPRWMLSQEK